MVSWNEASTSAQKARKQGMRFLTRVKTKDR